MLAKSNRAQKQENNATFVGSWYGTTPKNEKFSETSSVFEQKRTNNYSKKAVL